MVVLRHWLFCLFLVLNVASLCVVAEVKAADVPSSLENLVFPVVGQGPSGGQDPALRLKTTHGDGIGPGIDNPEEGGAVIERAKPLENPKVDVKTPEVEKNGKEKKEKTEKHDGGQQDRENPENDIHADIRESNPAQPSDLRITSSSSEVSSSAVVTSTAHNEQLTRVDGTLTQPSKSGTPAEDGSDQRDDVQGEVKQNSKDDQMEGTENEAQSNSSNVHSTGGTEPQETSDSQEPAPSSQEPQSNNGKGENSNAANTSSDPNTPSNEESTTTTTTTTIPPELTNNKKGDADSSSSISSSVWVRVPLLIVVTLACILVC
ncbi:uncharacterized protein TM35_000671180 [Trypanosoma theileri]|uniref:Mucin-associated surface protein (MASP) n=1 Tax=Trypanosoma theileri TaxID=67003 RepID=A0A1X0NFK8_9TRYP|nr:uncharacterized protein TM35_000671180 [Trypanosoma theileri]ORC83512.1 hypothetical protein TM35_000671180 [Trypanosoma theileri]